MKYIILLRTILGIILTFAELNHYCQGEGILRFEMSEFQLLHSKLQSGSRCELFGGKCDPKFIVCIKQNLHQTCSILYKSIGPYRNTHYLRNFKSFNITLPTPTPNNFEVTVKVVEHDNGGFQKDAVIAYFNDVFKLKPVLWADRLNQNKLITMNRKHLYYRNFAKLRIKLSLYCLMNYYGQYCQKYCKALLGRYKCGFDGEKICLNNYSGEQCDRKDFCRNESLCAERSTCVNLGKTYKCHCGSQNASTLRCYAGFQFCKEFHCENNGTCVNEPRRAKCHCPKPYEGDKCQFINSRCHHGYCKNNGTCVTKSLGELHCICTDEFEGQHCEIDVSKTQVQRLKTLPKIQNPMARHNEGLSQGFISILLIVFIGAFAIALMCCFVMSQKLKKKNRFLRSFSHISVIYQRASWDTQRQLNISPMKTGDNNNELYYTTFVTNRIVPNSKAVVQWNDDKKEDNNIDTYEEISSTRTSHVVLDDNENDCPSPAVPHRDY